jgi:hypothetical protein
VDKQPKALIAKPLQPVGMISGLAEQGTDRKQRQEWDKDGSDVAGHCRTWYRDAASWI